MTTNPKRKVPPHYVIRTPVIVVDDDSTKTLVACMCSVDQCASSWLVDERDLRGRKIPCHGSAAGAWKLPHEAAHGKQELISFGEAHELGLLVTTGSGEGAVLLGLSHVLEGLVRLRRPAKAS